MSAKVAAQIARDSATSETGEYATLSALMCWDAVVHCQVKGGGANPGAILPLQYDNVIRAVDPTIGSADAMRRVPQGAFIGFFEGPRLIHAMISTGHGMAAGNKNLCINIGNPVGWEILNLAGDLSWSGNGVNVGPRALTVRYRAMG